LFIYSDRLTTLPPSQVHAPASTGVMRFRMSRWAVRLALLLFVVSGISANSSAWGQDISKEYKLKAVYLYKFATYLTWPEKPQQQENEPFVIGVLGPDPVGADLRKIAKVKKINGRTIVVRNYQVASQVEGCHILFMSKDLQRNKQQAAIELLSGRDILTVGETKVFLEHGGVISFVIEANRITVHISKPAYEKEEFDISAQLLRIATISE
jgi:hypothetical protein